MTRPEGPRSTMAGRSRLRAGLKASVLGDDGAGHGLVVLAGRCFDERRSGGARAFLALGGGAFRAPP